MTEPGVFRALGRAWLFRQWAERDRLFGSPFAPSNEEAEPAAFRIIPPPPGGFPADEVEADLRPLTPDECAKRGIKPNRSDELDEGEARS